MGYTAEELRGLTVYDVSHPQDGKKTRQRVKRALAGDLPRYHREKRYLRKDGSIVWASVTVSLVQDSQGRPKYFIVLVEDISERKKAEQALRESEERFRDLARFLPETIFEMDPRGRLTFVNEQALTRFGYTRRDFAQGLNGLDMIASKDRERARQNMMEVMTGKDLGLNEYAAQKKGGDTFPVLMHSTPIIKDGQAAGLRGFIIDISEREKVARELRESEELYRATFELAPVGVSHLSPEGKYLQANQRFCQLLGYTREELAELTFSDLTHPEDAPGSVKRVQQALEGRPPKYPREKRYLRKDSSVLWASVTSSLVRDSAGRPQVFHSPGGRHNRMEKGPGGPAQKRGEIPLHHGKGHRRNLADGPGG